ncbi:MAG: MarR family transcriptional regulator [Myxococcota bacterium]|nr:MarR family transcriptional regulator [Myxococcota bacterium]
MREPISDFRRTHIGRALARSYELFQEQFERDIRARGFEDFRRSDVQVVSRLPVSVGARVSDLAQRAGITKQAMGKLVRSLEERGYLVCGVDPLDGRALRVELSPRGVELLRASTEVIASIEMRWAEVLGQAKLARVRQALLEVSDALGPPDYL